MTVLWDGTPQRGGRQLFVPEEAPVHITGSGQVVTAIERDQRIAYCLEILARSRSEDRRQRAQLMLARLGAA